MRIQYLCALILHLAQSFLKTLAQSKRLCYYTSIMNNMNKTQTQNPQDKSELEKMKLFFEHTEDNRVVMDAKSKPLKQPTRNSLSKR